MVKQGFSYNKHLTWRKRFKWVDIRLCVEVAPQQSFATPPGVTESEWGVEGGNGLISRESKA